MKWLLIFLFAAQSLFFAFRAAAYVGFINDDAAYITTALALLKGSYWNLASPQNKSVTQFWPGYPLALMPWVALCRPHWEILRLFSIGLTVLSCVLIVEIGSLYLSGGALVCLLAAFALHPSTLTNAANVMSEPLFLTLTLSYFWLLYRQLRNPQSNNIVGLVVLLTWIALVRPIGVVLYISTLVAFARVCRPREGLKIVTIALLVWILFPLWVFKVTQQPPSYLFLWRSSAPLFAQRVMDHWHRFGYLLFGHDLLGLHLSHSGLSLVLSFAAIVFSVCVCLSGLRKMLTDDPEKRALAWALAAFVFLSIGIHLVFLSIDERYFWPLLPVLILFFIAGIQSEASRLTQKRTGLAILAAAWIINVCWPDAPLMGQAWNRSRAPQFQRPDDTFNWIHSHASPESLLIGPQPLLYLYTGNKGVEYVEADNSEDFLYTILKNHFSYVVFLPGKINMPLAPRGKSHGERIFQMHRYVLRMPHVFVPVYTSPREQATVFKILPNPAYEQAYALYKSGLEDMRSGLLASAEEHYKKSLNLFPALGSTWTAYGILGYMQRDYAPAEKRLVRALEIDPENILARLHLARIQAFHKERAAAMRSYTQTKDLMEASGSYPELLPDVMREMSLQ